jgi:NhaP-type Na+/H+ or K+/H+ antiporter
LTASVAAIRAAIARVYFIFILFIFENKIIMKYTLAIAALIAATDAVKVQRW